MKTRMLAIALEMGRVSERRAQARGLVSSTMVRREGGGSEGRSVSRNHRRVGDCIWGRDHLSAARSARSHPRYPSGVGVSRIR